MRAFVALFAIFTRVKLHPAEILDIGNAIGQVAQTVGNVSGIIAAETAPVVTDKNPLSEAGIQDCYKDLGCFSNEYPWKSPLRPFPKPLHPDVIDVKMRLYNRQNRKRGYEVHLRPDIYLPECSFESERPFTAFLIHGFASNGNVSWVRQLKSAYLKRRDANFFVVDWGKGASFMNYLQVASNTRIVGAEIFRLVQFLILDKNLDTRSIHFIGHSLGAHIASYAAKSILQSFGKVGRITALDAAQPGFEGCPSEVRLDRSDAEFVEAVHTDGRPTIPFFGFGMMFPIAHVDYYLNGGLLQPGCVLPHPQYDIKGIQDLEQIPVETISQWVSCSHGRSYEYFIEAVEGENCTFWARKAGTIGAVLDIGTFGRIEPILAQATNCTFFTCVAISIEITDYLKPGPYAVTTRAFSPYCANDRVAGEEFETDRKRVELQNFCDTTDSFFNYYVMCSRIGKMVLQYFL